MSLPPGPTAPDIVQTWKWLRSPYQFLEESYAHYGDTFQFGIIGFGRVAVVVNPDNIKEIFAGSPEVFLGGESNRIMKPFVGENSLLVLDGPEHQRQRKLLMPAFHGERMQAYGKTMLELTNASIDTWSLHHPFSIQPYMQEITLKVILRTIFGVEEGAQLNRLAELARTGTELASNPLLLFPAMQLDLGAWSPWGKVQRMIKEMDSILRELVETRRKTYEQDRRTDILSMLLGAKDEDGQPMSFQELRDELVTMLVAGHETTATALSWTFSGLLQDAPLWQKLRTEVETAVHGGQLVPEKVAKLEFLDATVREGLRVRPVAPMIGRRLAQPIQINGYDIPAGWAVAPAVYLAHRRPGIFPNPDRFDPERFLRARPSPNEWLPFGGGARRCIGAAFATYEMKMVLATIIHRTSLELKPGYIPRAVRRGVTLAPSQGVPVVLTERRNPSRGAPAAAAN